MTTKKDAITETDLGAETELRSDPYATALLALEYGCKEIVARDEPDAGQLVDQTLRYLRVIRAEKKRLAAITKGTK